MWEQLKDFWRGFRQGWNIPLEEVKRGGEKNWRYREFEFTTVGSAVSFLNSTAWEFKGTPRIVGAGLFERNALLVVDALNKHEKLISSLKRLIIATRKEIVDGHTHADEAYLALREAVGVVQEANGWRCERCNKPFTKLLSEIWVCIPCTKKALDK